MNIHKCIGIDLAEKQFLPCLRKVQKNNSNTRNVENVKASHSSRHNMFSEEHDHVYIII